MPDPSLVAFLREFGLPMTMLIVFGVALQRRWFVTGTELERKQKLLEDEMAYRERLRVEERESRTAAEQRLAANVEATRELIEVVRDIERRIPRRE